MHEITESCSFKLSHYKDCLKSAKDKGYRFMTMYEFSSKRESLPEKNKVIVLRHDIDHYMNLLPNFTDIEKEIGVRATHYIRLHGKYNPFSYENYKIIKGLLDVQHEIGLHHECDLPNIFKEDEMDALKRNKKILETAINKDVFGVSSHAPVKSGVFLTDEIILQTGFQYHAYSDIFMKGMKYISDSGSKWREGCMCNFIKNNTEKLCILTHPIWWFKDGPSENY
jgi:hypothetical protein